MQRIRRGVLVGPDGCWEWQGSRHAKGYGRIGVEGHNLKTHRVTYTETFGPIPSGMHILHTCDNPPCCNPAHLRLGSNADNVADKVSKGRHGMKITPTQAEAIRVRIGTQTQRSLAREFGITQAMISRIKTGLAWKEAA
jgi:hypothetical protein